jgi:phosphomannomutase
MSSTIPEQLSQAARAWIDGDPDPVTQAELEQLLVQEDARELGERLAGPLEFGTAGLRGLVGAGPARMNRAVVIRTTRGLADHVLSRELDARSLPVVLGHDARSTSRAFAEDAAGVLVAAGIAVRFFERPVPTPLVAYAARQLGANAAIAVTASHNPPEYNGYKVYGANAVQIVPPLDIEIAARIAAVGPARSVPRVEHALEAPGELCQPIPDSIFERYLAELDALRPRRFADPELSIVYTPLHGVGWHFVERALRYAGYRRIHAVPEQAEPDGAFPTVRFPNPEEPGALDLATRLAEKEKADLILANDPDADRLAACVPTPSGRFVPLTGNQLGLLLADFVLEHAPRTPQPLVVSSLVSSPMLADVAAAHGARFEQTLTGFKWIWTAALDLERAGGLRFVYGYEEALGYCVGRLVRDKDGVGAAVVFADLAADCKASGQSLLERLDTLYRRHGLWVSVQKSVTRPGSQGLAEIERAMERAGREPPKSLGARSVVEVTDFRRGAEKRPRWLGTTSLVALSLDGGGRVLVRPSGTEPKLKIYVDLRVPLEREERARTREEAALAEARAIAEALATTLGLA